MDGTSKTRGYDDFGFNSQVSNAYYRVIRSVPSLLFFALCLALTWPRIQMIMEFVESADTASHWFAKQFCYSLAGWCVLSFPVLIFWLLVEVFPKAILAKMIHFFVVLRTAAWYCTLPGFGALYIAVTSRTSTLNMHVFLVTLLGGLLLLFIAGVYSFRLYSFCKITKDISVTLSTGASPYAFGYSFNMTAANAALGLTALIAADYMSSYTFLAVILKPPFANMLQALNAWMKIQMTSLEISFGEVYLDIPWVALISAAANIPLAIAYIKYMKASQISISDQKSEYDT